MRYIPLSSQDAALGSVAHAEDQSHCTPCEKPCRELLWCPCKPFSSTCASQEGHARSLQHSSDANCSRCWREGSHHLILFLDCLFSLMAVSAFLMVGWVFSPLRSWEKNWKGYPFLYCSCCYKEAKMRVTANSFPFLFFLFTPSVWTNAQGKKTARMALQSSTLF